MGNFFSPQRSFADGNDKNVDGECHDDDEILVNMDRAMSYQEERALFTQRLRSKRHRVPPSAQLPASIRLVVSPDGYQIYDTVVVHSRAQKRIAASTMVDLFRTGGFRTFMDYELDPSVAGMPTNQMGHALRTCRHIAVILSRDFLQRPDPCSELVYAFERMEWLRLRYEWQSLWIVFFDVSVDEYNSSRRDNTTLPGKELPEIGSSVTSYEFALGKGKYGLWHEQCHAVKGDMFKQDKQDKAILQWRKFLQNWDRNKHDIPENNGIYQEESQGNVSGADERNDPSMFETSSIVSQNDSSTSDTSGGYDQYSGNVRRRSSSSGEPRYADVFLCHAGKQKQIHVSSMFDVFESRGFHCFLDVNMASEWEELKEKMRLGMETSRHNLRTDAPREELQFAWRRHQWTQANFGYTCLWVILFDLKCSEYNEVRLHDPQLPDLTPSISCYAWFNFSNWVTMITKVQRDITRHDITHDAVNKWNQYLEQRELETTSFPSARELYDNIHPKNSTQAAQHPGVPI